MKKRNEDALDQEKRSHAAVHNLVKKAHGHQGAEAWNAGNSQWTHLNREARGGKGNTPNAGDWLNRQAQMRAEEDSDEESSDVSDDMKRRTSLHLAAANAPQAWWNQANMKNGHEARMGGSNQASLP